MEEKIDKQSLAIKRLNVIAEMPAFREKMNFTKGGNKGFGKEIKWGHVKGTDKYFSYYEDKTNSGTKYIITSDLIQHPNSENNGGLKVSKKSDVLDEIDGVEDIDSWGGKRNTKKK